jgi:hypothetical protein
MNLLGLADVYVRVRGPRVPAVLGVVPFGHTFLVEVGLDGQPFLSQGFWIPGSQLNAFREYWSTAKDLGLVDQAEVLPVRNTHFLFSPFHEIIHADGWAEIGGEVDNAHFEPLLRRHLAEPFEVKMSGRIATTPLVIPAILEHMWRHTSSRGVWQAIREKGEAHLRDYRKATMARTLEKPGAALRLLQRQWQGLLDHFEEVFLQPVVFWPPGLVRNGPLLSFTVRPGGAERTATLALRASEHSIVTAVMPQAGPDGGCRIWCTAPGDRIPALLRLMREFHRGPEPPVFGHADLDATRQLARPEFCGFDWRSFDPVALDWRFEGERYVERLKNIRTRKASGPPSERSPA